MRFAMPWGRANGRIDGSRRGRKSNKSRLIGARRADGRNFRKFIANMQTAQIPPPLTLALYQPDIPQNTGTILRLCACLGLAAAIIEPAGFPVGDRRFRRAGMDYLAHVEVTRHASWAAFEAWRSAKGGRLVLLSTAASLSYASFSYAPGDILLFGRESAGAPDAVHQAADARLVIPLKKPMRSLNVAVAAAMAAGEAARQLRLV
jgi:tRNA (cytidine/uridine-2'-O-)-methyltransferase